MLSIKMKRLEGLPLAPHTSITQLRRHLQIGNKLEVAGPQVKKKIS
jgi:hypothetical protein